MCRTHRIDDRNITCPKHTLNIQSMVLSNKLPLFGKNVENTATYLIHKKKKNL